MGKKYGRSITLNISGYEHSTRKDNRTYSLFVCPLWFVVFSAAFGLLFHRCHSCYKTELCSREIIFCFSTRRDTCGICSQMGGVLGDVSTPSLQ